MKPAAEREIQNNAQMIYGWLKTMPTPRDATATMMMAQAALVWSQRPADEATVRELMAQYTEGVVALWKAQSATKETAANGG
jgi:hypothetical protein